MQKNKSFPLLSAKDRSILLTMEHITDPSSLREPHAHQPMEILFFVQGKGTLRAQEKEMEFQDGDIFIFDSMQAHQICEIAPDPSLEAFSLRFALSAFINEEVHVFGKQDLDTFSSRLCSCEHKIYHSHSAAGKIQNLMFDIADCLEADEAGKEYLVRSMVLLLFARIVHYYNEGFSRTDLKKTNHRLDIERTMLYIQQNLSEHIVLDTLAQIANMNKNYYSSVFRQVTGMTVWDYILNARVELAGRYLVERQADLNITEISHLCGFNSITNFNKVFKKYTGKTPTEYKNSGQNACFSE